MVHNALMFDKPEKSVVYGPFRMWPKPSWFLTHRKAHKLAPKILTMAGNPSLIRLPGILLNAFG